MSIQLKVHPSFFKEFATKTWISPFEIVKELVENAFDEDATKVLITILNNGSIVVEDDAGMDAEGIEKFLLLGSPHKKIESLSPKLKRIRTGRYGTGRLSFLTSFASLKIKTKKDNYSKCLVIDESSLNQLFTGNSLLKEIKEKPLSRNGTELSLNNVKMNIDPLKLSKEIRKLAILRQPLFQIFIKQADQVTEWDFNGSDIVKAQEIQGYHIPVNLDNGQITGEIVVARRPLTEEEKGIGIMIGNHIVVRSHFGFDAKLNRITGLIRCDALTSRFADKSAIIEDDAYYNFNKFVKQFIAEDVIPKLSQYEDVLITKEESRIYREIDKVLGQAVIENLESVEVEEEYETVEDKVSPSDGNSSNENSISITQSKTQDNKVLADEKYDHKPIEISNTRQPAHTSILEHQTIHPESEPTYYNPAENLQISPVLQTAENSDKMQVKKIKTLKRTFALKKIGYKVIPYEDETDSRYGFTNENVVFVNKANSAYKAEAERGDEFLLRHIIRIVAEAIAEEKHPEGKDALELQNRLIGEAIKIHNLHSRKK
ncbi:MAG TPA: ATP-binding protein [Nitrososphaeraceae archaeon]|nr:ATP-binding protein [Nitrososphaeraceae archaeon]